MGDMGQVIVPKSDQLNADDLIAGQMTVKITGVAIRQGQEQPISISFEGDNGKPYKPCKSMCRVMVTAWGADSAKYAGRSMTLYRDPTVKWGGMDVGGIRISHMSDIEKPMTLALTATRGNRKPYTVKPIEGAKTVAPGDVISEAQKKRLEARIGELKLDREAIKNYCKSAFNKEHFADLTKPEYADLDTLIDKKAAQLAAPADGARI